MKPVFFGQRPGALDVLDFLPAHAVLASVNGDHHIQTEIEQKSGHCGHQQDIEIRNFQELGNQECSSAENRRRNNGTQTPSSQQTPRRIFVITGFGQHVVGHSANGDRGSHTRARRATQQKRRHHHGLANIGGLAAHQGEGKINEELARPAELQKCAKDGEQNNQGCRNIHRSAKNSL